MPGIEPRPLLLSAPLVAAAHAALLWAAMQWTAPPPDMPPAASFAIDLEPAAAAPAPIPVPTPPQPKAEPQPQAQPRAEIPPPPRPVAKPAPKRAPAPPPSPVAEKTEPASEPTAPPAPPEPVAAAPARTAPAAPPAPTAPAAEMTRWQGLLMAHLERHKRYPRDARMRRQEGVVAVRFVMDSSGRVLSAVIERPSGVESLDRETLALLERAQPMPHPPGGTGERVDLVVPVQFQLR